MTLNNSIVLQGLALLAVCLFGLQANQVNSQHQQQGLSCLDQHGKPVDWYMGYKFPKIKSKKDDRFLTGFSYAYITSDDVGPHQEEIKKIVETPLDESDQSSSGFIVRFKNLLLRYMGHNSSMSRIQTVEKKSTPKRGSKKTSASQSTPRWILSPLPINSPDSAVLRTLSPVRDDRVSVVLYNDDPGETVVDDDTDDDEPGVYTAADGTKKRVREITFGKAHAKGVLMMHGDTNSAVWFTHSMPRFPPRANEPLTIPESAQFYGQTFMCISLDLRKSGIPMVDHVRTLRPLIYERRVDENLYNIIPDLRDLDTSKNLRESGQEAYMMEQKKLRKTNLVQTITTRGGQPLSLFAKGPTFGRDLWAGWVDEELGSSLYVETWRRGRGDPVNSTCPSGDFHINNVKDLKYDEKAGWSFMNDHSKWAISDEREHANVCLGDSNRMESQYKRGGGAVCIKCLDCWDVFSNTIQDVEPCPRGSKKVNKKTDDSDHGLIRRIAKALHL